MNKKKKSHNQSFNSRDESLEDSLHRKIVISKVSKGIKESGPKQIRTIKTIKTKKTKKVRKNSPKKSQRVNHTTLNMNSNDTSVCNENYINKSYQQEYNFEGSLTKNTLEDAQRNFDQESEEINIHGEIELDPIKPENGVEELQPQEWENIEMFSSKKFSDILRKHKKMTRYQDSEFNEEQESLMDTQSNRKSINNLQDTDDCDEEKDPEHHQTYEKPLSRENFDGVLQPPQEFNKIRKISGHHAREISNQGEMKMEELKTFQNLSRDPQVVASHVKEFSDSITSNNKILTASINLLDKDIFSEEKPPQIEDTKEDKEDKDDSLWKPPNWNFAEPQKEGFFEGNVTSKRVIVDDLEDFQYDDPVPYDGTGGSGHDVLENASVFDHENPGVDPDQIPFSLEEDLHEKEHEEKINTDTQGEDNDTLKQMRILFGSEQRIREQSEAAIKNLTQEEPEEDHDSEPEEFQTPGISQHEESSKINSRIFGKQSFQDFSRKKFQEIMFDGNMSEFMNSVERTVRETVGESKTYRKLEEKQKDYTSYTPKKTSFASPRKFNRKELELDSIVGKKMKYMSEKKKARKSMLENYDSSLIKDFPQDPFNNSQEVYKAKFANYSNKKSNDGHSQRRSIDRKSGPGLEHFDQLENPNKKVDIERTDQVFIKSKLQSSNEVKINSAQEPESIRRSNVRGLEVMISENSQEMEKSNHLEADDDENKTLKYDLTEERTEKRSLECSKNNDDSKLKESPKDIMYDQLEKIMGNCFTNEKKDSIIDAQDYKTLKYADSEEAIEEINKGKESSGSEISSPTTAKRINRVPPVEQEAVENTEEISQKKSEIDTLITPRDTLSKNSYQTPEDHRNNLPPNIAQKEVSKEIFQKSFESGRREDAFSLQFYSNNSQTEENQEDREPDNNEENIRIYVDQWDGDNSEKKSEPMSADPFNCTESIGIHTAKNSPFESNTKEKNSNMSEKYSVTEESGEKYISSEAKIGGNAFDYKKPSLNNIRKNLHSTLQDNLNNSSNSFDFKDSLSAKSHSILKNTQSTIEINDEIKEVGEELDQSKEASPQIVKEYPHMVSPSENEIVSPNYMEENQ